MIIAILTPSRGRPEKLERFIKSVDKTSSTENTIYHFVGVDRNDPELETYLSSYKKTREELLHNFIILNSSEQKPVGIIWNDLQRLAEGMYHPDYYIMGNDDLVYQTNNWDIILEKTIRQLKDPYHVLWFNDGINGDKLAAFPIVSKEWVKAVGSFCPTIFEFLCNDLWIFDVAKSLDHLKFIPEVVTEHLHFSQNKSLNDSTYRMHRDNGATSRDLSLYKLTEKHRAVWIDKIKLCLK